jgi:hypothetical protein
VPSHLMTRRVVFGALALPALVGCGTPLPIVPAPPKDAGAARVLRESAESHGLRAYRDLIDINIAYEARGCFHISNGYLPRTAEPRQRVALLACGPGEALR